MTRYGQEIMPATPEQVDELMDAVVALEPDNPRGNPWGITMDMPVDEALNSVLDRIIDVPFDEGLVTDTTHDMGFAVRTALGQFRAHPRPYETALSITVGRQRLLRDQFILRTTVVYEAYVPPRMPLCFALRCAPFSTIRFSDDTLIAGIDFGKNHDPDLARAFGVLQDDKAERDALSPMQDHGHAMAVGRARGEMNRLGLMDASRQECEVLTGAIRLLRRP